MRAYHDRLSRIAISYRDNLIAINERIHVYILFCNKPLWSIILANSHKNCGWQIFTDDIIKKLNERDTPIVFILWGANARSKKQYITNPIHYVIESAHPSPLSAYNGFFGSKPFSRTNEFLEKNGIAPIEWEIKD